MANCSSSFSIAASQGILQGTKSTSRKHFERKDTLKVGSFTVKAAHEQNKHSNENDTCKHQKSTQRLVSVTKRQLLLGGSAALMAVACPACVEIAANAENWEYGSLTGPSEWNNICVDGTTQSPIDLPTAVTDLLEKDPLGPIDFSYKGSNPTFFNTGHGTMQVNFEGDSNFIKVGEKKFFLKQYHFHAPSEHSFNGKKAAMEAHLVHQAENGQLAVIGVMMEADAFVPRNLCLQAALDFAPEEKRATVPTPIECFIDETSKGPNEPDLCFSLEINPTALLPKPTPPDGRRPYYHYNGSLTTPPCLENVEWFMLNKPLVVPAEQVLEFMTYVGEGQSLAMNSRPVQKIGDRVITFGA